MSKNQIETTVDGWPGVSVEPHRFGGRAFTLNDREIGHVHNGRLVDIPFTKHLRDILIKE